MGLASVLENLNFTCNCFWPNKSKNPYEYIQNQYYKKNDIEDDIHILPTNEHLHLTNLYPSTNATERWSVLCVGSDMTYIKVSLGDFKLKNMENLTNKKGGNIISKEVNAIFEPIWNSTLKGQRLQFFMLVNGYTYLVNTFPLENIDRVIGAIMFIRNYTVEKRDSLDGGNRTLLAQKINDA